MCFIGKRTNLLDGVVVDEDDTLVGDGVVVKGVVLEVVLVLVTAALTE